jgi:hypothetical protein
MVEFVEQSLWSSPKHPHKSKANNTASCWLYRSLRPTSQPIHIVITSSLLIRGPLVYLTKFLGSCVQVSCLIARFSSLST